MTFKSAVVEHGFKENHIIDWDGSDILAKDNIKNTRRIRESIWIRRKGGKNMNSELMNAEDGAYLLSNLYDQLLQKTSSSTNDVTPSA